MKTQITLNLTPAEAAGLRARSAEFGVSPEALLTRFICDLTGAPLNGGSDERDFAKAWADRSLWFGTPPKTVRAQQRLWRFQSDAWERIKQAEDEARAARPMMAGGAR